MKKMKGKDQKQAAMLAKQAAKHGMGFK